MKNRRTGIRWAAGLAAAAVITTAPTLAHAAWVEWAEPPGSNQNTDPWQDFSLGYLFGNPWVVLANKGAPLDGRSFYIFNPTYGLLQCPEMPGGVQAAVPYSVGTPAGTVYGFKALVQETPFSNVHVYSMSLSVDPATGVCAPNAPADHHTNFPTQPAFADLAMDSGPLQDLYLTGENGYMYSENERWADTGGRNIFSVGSSLSSNGMAWVGTTDGAAWQYLGSGQWVNHGGTYFPSCFNVYPEQNCNFGVGGAAMGAWETNGLVDFWLFSAPTNTWVLELDAMNAFFSSVTTFQNAGPWIDKILEGGYGIASVPGRKDQFWVLSNNGTVWAWEQ